MTLVICSSKMSSSATIVWTTVVHIIVALLRILLEQITNVILISDVSDYARHFYNSMECNLLVTFNVVIINPAGRLKRSSEFPPCRKKWTWEENWVDAILVLKLNVICSSQIDLASRQQASWSKPMCEDLIRVITGTKMASTNSSLIGKFGPSTNNQPRWAHKKG
jgi:hypothetical protein